MDKRKALLVFALALALSVWSGSKGAGPLAVWPVAEDLCIGIVGTLGLAFGVDDDIKNPPSLKNIEKELKQDLNLELSSSTLEQWAKQGVLLLNAALTVKPGTPTSHMDLWLPFTKYIIDYLNKM